MKRLAMMAAVMLVMCAHAFADVIELKTGQRVEGTFKQGTSTSIAIEIAGQTITFELDKVRAIYFGSDTVAPIAQASKAAEALRALKGLQSATTAGISYRDYAPRVTDAKIIVDRYLDEPEKGDGEGRRFVKAAIHYYVLAANAWNVKVVRGASPNAVGLDPTVNECAPARQLIEERRREKRDWEFMEKTLGAGYNAGSTIAFFGLPALWSCASDRIAEAEKLLASERK